MKTGRNKIEFEVEKEVWNKYKLKDGTILRIKCVLVKLFKFKEKGEEGYNINSHEVIGTIAPDKLLGNPSKGKYTPKQLVKSIIEEDIDFEMEEENWNWYKLSDGRILKLKSVPTKISKTDKFDSVGEPIYLVQSQTMVKSIHPKTQRVKKLKPH